MEETKQAAELGAARAGEIHCVTVIGQVEGHQLLPDDARRITRMDELEEPMDFNMEELPKQQVNYRKYDYTKLSIYELKCLLRRKFNSVANQKNAKCELERRGLVLSRKYNRCKEKRKVRNNSNEGY